ncbi:MAG: DNA-J related domain-containing protein [Gammaproteobacteria bacterium]|nr:MAG: DNA-J related domain-containing protein [Gammaproteobacteria bacterium]
MTKIDIAILKNRVLHLLQQHGEGISETRLLKALQNPENGGEIYHSNNITDLFRIHFLLLHVLYLLQDELLQGQQACLEISPLNFQIHPFDTARQNDITEHDTLRVFYSDLSNLDNVDEQQLGRWLGKFWVSLPANERRKQALATLGLQDPVDDMAIKEQYRRLAMRHHPDRGGDNEILQSINIAMKILSGEI